VTAEVPEAVLRLAERTGSSAGPRAAAFDADGTLWHGDVSEDFTRWMIARGHFDGALWPRYEEVNRRDGAAGCLEVLRFYRERPLGELRARVAEFWQTTPPRPWKPAVVATFRWLAAHDVTMYVVSGTPRLVLEPLSQHLPVRGEDILALELAFDGRGCATGAHQGIVTCGAGKAERLRAAGAGRLLVAAGNSVLDREMLQLATACPWVIDPDERLRTFAAAAGWPIYDTPHG
jgi:HAD superfamily phosphoserine phosphatase-like hydrolase